ncbi:Guanine/hypoxanthine permease pbuG [Lysinibacillus sphaericus]|nr:Guanine/hypoxanthine permease pbuG [Lysinibacillus sphaericus]
MLTNLIEVPDKVVSSVPSVAPTFGAAFETIFNTQANCLQHSLLSSSLHSCFVDFFDTAGTLVAVATQAGLMKEGKLPRAGRALLADSMATVTGAIFGTSTTTSYVESTAGVAAGAKTGFASVITGLLFLLALFFSPLLFVITPEVTAPALIIVGVLMVSNLGSIEWTRFEMAVPAFFTVIAMPLTYSIATGIRLDSSSIQLQCYLADAGKKYILLCMY